VSQADHLILTLYDRVLPTLTEKLSGPVATSFADHALLPLAHAQRDIEARAVDATFHIFELVLARALAQETRIQDLGLTRDEHRLAAAVCNIDIYLVNLRAAAATPAPTVASHDVLVSLPDPAERAASIRARLIRLAPEAPELFHGLGWAQMESNFSLSGAVEDLERALSLHRVQWDPARAHRHSDLYIAPADILETLVTAHLASGDKDAALAAASRLEEAVAALEARVEGDAPDLLPEEAAMLAPVQNSLDRIRETLGLPDPARDDAVEVKAL
jgi:hypothetical protein